MLIPLLLLTLILAANVAFAAESNSELRAATPIQTEVFISGDDGYHTFRIPSVILTAKSNLLAFAEGRKNGAGDAGQIELVLRRSFDQGKTWQPLEHVWRDATNTCGNPCSVLDRDTGVIWLLMTWNLGSDREQAIVNQTSQSTRKVFVTSSRDDGAGWSTPREITSSVKSKDWTWYATGPGAGIQIEHGPNRGRLVIPCDHIVAKTKEMFSHVIYSDDHGATWKIGGTSPKPQVNECEVVELSRNRLMLNMRNYDPSDKSRQIAFSLDGGLTWMDQRHAMDLIEPTCQASIRRISWPGENSKGIVLFSNPASTQKRERMTVRASFDDGQTWPVMRTLYDGIAAYSCLTPLANSMAGCLYECTLTNAVSPSARSNVVITFARFPVSWLAELGR